MHKNIPVKNVVPNMLNSIDYSKLISNQANNNQAHTNSMEAKGKSLKLSKKLNNYRNKTF